MFHLSRSRRGMALMTTLVILTFLLLLTGALVKTQSGLFAISKSSDSQIRVDIACDSLYSFCLYQLEHQRTWGQTGFASLAEVDPVRVNGTGASLSLHDRVDIQSVEDSSFSGFLPEQSSYFRVAVHNAMTSGVGLNLGTAIEAPPEHVRLEIETWSGTKEHRGSSKNVNVLLKLAPLFDASLLTRGDIQIQADRLYLASKDPFRNELRADGKASLPGLRNGMTRFVEYQPDLLEDTLDPADLKPDNSGLLWSTDKILDDGHTLSELQLQEVARRSSGRVIADATHRLDVYDLKPENLPAPNSAGFTHDVEIPPGEFRFTSQRALVTYEKNLRYENDDGDMVDNWVEREEQQDLTVVAHFLPGQSTPSRIFTTNKNVAEQIRILDIKPQGNSDGVPVEMGSRFYLNHGYQGGSQSQFDEDTVHPENGIRSHEKGGSGAVYFDLPNYQLRVEPNTRVRVGTHAGESSFEVTTQQDENGVRPPGPTYALGGRGNDVVLECDGDITLQGGLMTGLGTLVSRQSDVNLSPLFPEIEWEPIYLEGILAHWIPKEFKIDITANENYEGLVVYAGKDVNINNPHDLDWTFRGFVYAKERFNFEAKDGNGTFFGTVVAGQSGNIQGEPSLTIKDARKLNFIYDPSYLKLLTRNLPNNWTRVERVIWSEANS